MKVRITHQCLIVNLLTDLRLAIIQLSYHTLLMNKDNICYPFVVGGLEAVLRHMIPRTIPGIKITDEAAYRKSIEEQIASLKEISKEYYRP